MTDQEVFLKHINDHYTTVVSKLKILCSQRRQKFSEDTFHNAIIKCHSAIGKKGGLNDKSPYGIESYLLKAYFNLVIDEKRVCVSSKRDWNYDDENIGELQEEWSIKNQVDAREKIISDMFKDFAVLYIMMVVESNFDSEHFYLFKLKELCKDMTYKKLAEKTRIKGVRQKVVTVKRWLQQNLSKDEIRKEFYEIYGDLL